MSDNIEPSSIHWLTHGNSRNKHNDDDADRIDSIHDSQLVDLTGVRASISAPPPRPGPAAGGSLFDAVRRASTFIGDGVCESRKELMLLGVLPEPEEDEEEIISSMRTSVTSVQYRAAVPGATLEDDEVYDEYSVSPTDTRFKAHRCTPAPLTERTVTVPGQRNFEAEQNEERAIRASFQAFTFHHPPPSTQTQTPLQHLHGWDLEHRHAIATVPTALPSAPQISREEMLWSQISPSTALIAPWETFLSHQDSALRRSMDEKFQAYIFGLEVPRWCRIQGDSPGEEPAYERWSTEPAFCSDDYLWEGRFPLEWKHYVRSGSL